MSSDEHVIPRLHVHESTAKHKPVCLLLEEGEGAKQEWRLHVVNLKGGFGKTLLLSQLLDETMTRQRSKSRALSWLDRLADGPLRKDASLLRAQIGDAEAKLRALEEDKHGWASARVLCALWLAAGLNLLRRRMTRAWKRARGGGA